MGIPSKALRLNQLPDLESVSAISDSSHKTYPVTFKDEQGVERNAFFKAIAPEDHYPELLAKMSVAASSFKRLFQGKRSAEERLVFDNDGKKIIGTLSIGVDGFKPFNFANEKVPVDSSLREQVIPSYRTLIEKNIMEILLGRWFLDDDDAHPHNVSLEGDIDFDMFWYWFTIHMKVPRNIVGIPKTHVSLSVRDWENFPDVQDSKPFHSPTYSHPGKVTLPEILPGQAQVLPKVLRKVYADPTQFARLAKEPTAQEQKLGAALKALLTFQPEVQRARLVELFGDLPLNYASLDDTLRKTYEELYPRFCNEETNVKSFVDFIMALYQEHYDNLYRVVVFYMGRSKEFGMPLPATFAALYQKPSFYKNAKDWVEKENERAYKLPFDEDRELTKEEELLNEHARSLQYNLPKLQIRYHQVWRDAFGPTLKELLHSSYRLTNALLKENTTPPHPKLAEVVSKPATDNSITESWELFGTMPELSVEAITAKISVDKDSKLREALLYMVEFTQQLHDITKAYYTKKRHELTEEDNLEFSNKLGLLQQQYNSKIRLSLANTTTPAGEFTKISSRLQTLAEQVNFQVHLTTDDKFMEDLLSTSKKDELPFTHEEVRRQYNDSLFVWAKGLKPEDLERYVTDIIDKKYAPLLSGFSWRQRAEPVKEYLRSSRQERGDNRLAYILSSGTAEDGALNTALIEDLTPLMLQKHHIQSIDNALRDKSFQAGIDDFTKEVVNFAKKDKRFTHPFSDAGLALRYKAIYDWADDIKRTSFEAILKSVLRDYEGGSIAKSWGLTYSRRDEVQGYLNDEKNCNAKVLAMTFMNGKESSDFNERLLTKIIKLMKLEITKYPRMLEDPKYKAIEQFNIEEHKAHYLANLKHHPETIAASNRQIRVESASTLVF